MLIDEVHLLSEPGRGAALEAGCVCRIKMLARLPEMAGVRFLCNPWEEWEKDREEGGRLCCVILPPRAALR